MFQWLGIATTHICAKAKIPLVIGAHGGFTENSWAKGRIKKTVYWHCFLKKAFSRATATHFTTEYERTKSARLLRNYKSFIVPNSIDTSIYQIGKQEEGNLFRKRYGIPADAPLLITVARADPNKRVDLLIEALVEISDLFLLVVGPEVGKLTMKWQKQSEKLNVADRIIWTGYLHGKELLDAYTAADIFGLISRSENFGMVVIEAMAFGLPVLLNPDVGISEELKEIAGVMVVKQDAKAIVEALKAFLSQRAFLPLWQENCSSFPREQFAGEKVAPIMAQAFADCLKGTQSPLCRWKN
jgi:glycosyltransferase involved in cell wall biosynthesis